MQPCPHFLHFFSFVHRLCRHQPGSVALLVSHPPPHREYAICILLLVCVPSVVKIKKRAATLPAVDLPEFQSTLLALGPESAGAGALDLSAVVRSRTRM